MQLDGKTRNVSQRYRPCIEQRPCNKKTIQPGRTRGSPRKRNLSPIRVLFALIDSQSYAPIKVTFAFDKETHKEARNICIDFATSCNIWARENPNLVKKGRTPGWSTAEAQASHHHWLEQEVTHAKHTADFPLRVTAFPKELTPPHLLRNRNNDLFFSWCSDGYHTLRAGVRTWLA